MLCFVCFLQPTTAGSACLFSRQPSDHGIVPSGAFVLVLELINANLTRSTIEVAHFRYTAF